MKKKFDTNTVMNELRGQSVFFPNTKAETEQEMAVSTPPTLQKENIQPEMEVSERCPDTVIPRHHDTMQPGYHKTITPNQEESIEEKVRKAVKQIGKEAATHRFTLAEKHALADIEYSYKRQGIRTSENEITRIAMNYFVEDYRQNGENSMLAKILKMLNS